MRHLFFSLITLAWLLAACQTAPTVEEEAIGVVTAVAIPTITPIPPTATATITATPPSSTTTPSPTPTPTPPPLDYLAAAIEQELASFNGLSSYVIRDLQTGEEITHEPNLAISGMSLLKIPILINTYRVLDRPPDIEQRKLITQTTSLSSNYSANLLMQIIARQPNTYIGADIVTQSMRDLGLFNTFIAVPFYAEPKPDRPQTYLTPANQRTDISARPDIHRQTTTGDLAAMLEMLYTCAEHGRSPLLTLYPDEITREECQDMLEMLKLNDLVELLEAGLPDGTVIAHKLGYVDETYGDVAIVYSPNRDYMLALALYAPIWLEWDIASPLFARISQLTYAHFNDPLAYTTAVLANPPARSNTPTPPPTPDLPQAIVVGTSGIGLTLRATPGGAELAILPEGSVVSLLDTPPTTLNGITWQHVRAPNGDTGWVGAAYLTRH